jgi:chromosome segregation ATPase
MTRRIIKQNDSDSLKAEKAKTEVLKSQADTAERRIHEAGGALTEIQADINKAEDVRQNIEDSIAVSKSNKVEADNALEEKQSELRKVEGELSDAISGLDKIKADTQKAQSEHTQKLVVLKADHDATRSQYEKTRADLLEQMADSQKTIESRKKEADGIEAVITRFKIEETKFERDVLPLIPKGKEELEALNRELLVKKVAVKDEEDKLVALVAKTNEEKSEYDQVVALRTSEEEIIAANMQKLVEKEGEVDKKMRIYRTLKEGVDQATNRLKRREEDLVLENHLSNSKADVTNK